MTEIYIDADACPVKDETIRVAERHGISLNIAGNAWLRLPFIRVPVQQVVVEKTPDAADNWIAEHIRPFDIVVTADIPLASRCLAKNAFAVGVNGHEWTTDNIGMALGMRDLNGFLRETGEKTKGKPPFSQKERSQFLNTLETVVQKALKRA